MQPITVVRGTTRGIGVTVYDEDGELYTLGSGEVLRFGVKKEPQDADYLIKLETTTRDSEGAYIFSLVPSNTLSLPCGRYYYDIGLKSGTNYYNVVECSYFDIAFNITDVNMTV